ncbi:hypothetical protein JOD27_002056 [Lentzea nigeriaca]|nr:hypothetical protein [Lentzea nigeriaca]
MNSMYRDGPRSWSESTVGALPLHKRYRSPADDHPLMPHRARSLIRDDMS